MTLSILAVLFLVFLMAIAVYGYGFMMKPTRPTGEEHIEQCFLCRKKRNRADLIERTVGDYKVVYFCSDCIRKLNDDLQQLGQ